MTGDVFNFYIGIGSKLQRKHNYIGGYDEYAIIYNPYNGTLSKGLNGRSNQLEVIKLKPGEDIHFRFQPKLKKFSISLVCLLLTFTYSESLVILNFRKTKNILTISKKESTIFR